MILQRCKNPGKFNYCTTFVMSKDDMNVLIIKNVVLWIIQ